MRCLGAECQSKERKAINLEDGWNFMEMGIDKLSTSLRAS
jgi:hypothetical protein